MKAILEYWITEYCLTSSENKAWKNSDSYGIWTYDLCDTGGALYQLS